jgi:hypothetical protein
MLDEVRKRLVVIEDWLWINVIGFRETLWIATRAYERNVLMVQGGDDRRCLLQDTSR